MNQNDFRKKNLKKLVLSEFTHFLNDSLVNQFQMSSTFRHSKFFEKSDGKC